VSYVDPFGLEIRSLTSKERDIVIKAINQIKEYGFATGDLMRLLEQGSIKVDTDLVGSGTHPDALGKADKFFECFYLAAQLFGMDFDLFIVPTIAHEYAHILDWRPVLFPMDKFLFHGFTFGFFAEKFPNEIEKLMQKMYFEREKEWLRNRHKRYKK
jgi:hypothetical protein